METGGDLSETPIPPNDVVHQRRNALSGPSISDPPPRRRSFDATTPDERSKYSVDNTFWDKMMNQIQSKSQYPDKL